MRIFPTTPPAPTWDTTCNALSIPVAITTDLASSQSIIGILINTTHIYIPNDEAVLTWETFVDDYADWDGRITHIAMLTPFDIDAHIFNANTHIHNACVSAIWDYADDVVLKALLT